MLKFLFGSVAGLLLAISTAALAAGAQRVEIEVSGMTCPFCVYGTQKKLSKLPGVDEVAVSLDEKKARLVMKPGAEPDMEAIRQAITSAGFTPGKAIVTPITNGD